ncbi:MAG TPA: hypothetical protein VF761_19330 [Gemmatimonadaceae bacterium]
MLTRLRVLPSAAALVLAAGCSSDKVSGPKPVTQQCASSGSLSLGGTTNGNLSSATCRFSYDSSRVQHYSFTLTQATPVAFSMTATNGDFDTFLLLYRNAYGDTANIVAFNDDADASTSNSVMHTILGPGSYVVAANHLDPQTFGAYALSAATWNGSEEDCGEVFMTTGTSSEQSIATTDCANSQQTQYGDVIALYSNPGQPLYVTVTSSWVTTLLELYDPAGNPIDSDDHSAGGNVTRVSAPATTKGGLYVLVVTAAAQATGPYTLAVSSTGSAVAAQRASGRATAVETLGEWRWATGVGRAKSAR